MSETVYNRIKYVYDELNNQHYVSRYFAQVERDYESDRKPEILIFIDEEFSIKYYKEERVFRLKTTLSGSTVNHEYINKMECLYEVVREANMNIKNIPYS